MIKLSKVKLVKRSLLLMLGIVSLLGGIFAAAKMIKTLKVDAADGLDTVTIESPDGINSLPGWVMYKSSADPVDPPTLDGKTLINYTINLSTPHIGIMKPDGTQVDYDAYCLNPTLTAPNGEYSVVTMSNSAQNNQIKLAVYLSSVYRNINNKFTADEQAPINNIVASWFSAANPSTQKWDGTAGEYREQDEGSESWHAVYDGAFPNVTTTEGKKDYVYLMIHLAISYLLNGDIDNLYSTYMNYSNNNTQDKQDWDFINEILDTLSNSVEPEDANYDIWLKAQNYVLYGIVPKTEGEQNVVWIEDGNPASGNLKVQKCDKETNACSPQSGASFQGITFTVANNSGARIYNAANETYYDNGEVMATGTTGTDGTYTFSGLPVNVEYKITETTTNASYILPDPTEASQTTVITTDGSTVTSSFYDYVKRGDFKFTKVDANDDSAPMANVAFRITNSEGTESHIIVSDENGEVNTAKVDHSKNTNGYDQYVNDDGELITSIAYNSNIGIWFGGGTPNNSRGALPYDTYTITELECDANNTCIDIESNTVEVTINSDNQMVDLGDIDNYCATLKTTATDAADGDKEILAAKDAAINDHIEYCLTANTEYTILGILMDKNTGKPIEINGESVTQKIAVTPEENCGTADMEFEFDATGMGGVEIVVFETALVEDPINCPVGATDENGCFWPDDSGDDNPGYKIIVSHEDLDDADQTIKVVDPEKAPETGKARYGASDTSTISGGSTPIIIIASISCAIVYLVIRFTAKKRFFGKR